VCSVITAFHCKKRKLNANDIIAIKVFMLTNVDSIPPFVEEYYITENS